VDQKLETSLEVWHQHGLFLGPMVMHGVDWLRKDDGLHNGIDVKDRTMPCCAGSRRSEEG